MYVCIYLYMSIKEKEKVYFSYKKMIYSTRHKFRILIVRLKIHGLCIISVTVALNFTFFPLGDRYIFNSR